MGVDRHQFDITSLRVGINGEAAYRAAAGPQPWLAISQIKLVGCQRPDGSAYDVYPDIMVFTGPIVDRRRLVTQVSLGQKGAKATH